MGLEGWIVKQRNNWHTMMLFYYLSLQDSCIDSAIKCKLTKKIIYHRDKLNNSTSNQSTF
jgi:hypothetical protein